MSKLALLLSVLLMLGSISAQAQIIEVSGTGVIVNGDLAAARKMAREDALHQATLQVGASVSSRDRVELGRVTESTLEVRGKAHLHDLRPMQEIVDGDMLRVTYEADIRSVEVCRSPSAGVYRKHLGILGFSLQNHSQAAIGGLQGVERGIASQLATNLVASKEVLIHEASNIRLFGELINAPTSATHERTLTKAVDAARELGVQFVVSGIVRDISLRTPDSYANDLITNTLRYWELNDLERNFVVDMFVHDGFSGAILFEQRYAVSGEWIADRYQQLPFMSSAFLDLDYGQKVAQLLGRMAQDIEANVSCQPFMTRIARVEDRTILFESGANSGIRPGDRFQIYRTRQLFSGTRFQGTHLADVKQVLQVSQVQPEFSLGRLNTDPTRLNIQEDDVLVRW